MSQITQSDVFTVIEAALGMKHGSLSETMLAEEIENWDSLGQLNILIGLDKIFTGEIASITEMAEADSVAKILDILKKHLLL